MTDTQVTTTETQAGASTALQTSDPAAQAFALSQRQASALANSTLAPQNFRGNVANCLIALNMAKRLNADPLMVMQNLYVVHGNPGWSSKFLIATFNLSGKFGPIQYRFTGKKGDDSYGCVAYATDLRTNKEVEGPEITIALSKAEGWHGKKGSKWQTIPDLMLRYRSAAWLINTVAPEISMGIQTEDELRDTIDMSQQDDGSFATDADALENFAGATETLVEEEDAEIVDDEDGDADPSDETETDEDPEPAEEGSGDLLRGAGVEGRE